MSGVGQSTDEYEASLSNRLAIEQMRSGVLGSAFISDAEFGIEIDVEIGANFNAEFGTEFDADFGRQIDAEIGADFGAEFDTKIPKRDNYLEVPLYLCTWKMVNIESLKT